MLEFKYDTQLLIEGENLDEDEISEYFTREFDSCIIKKLLTGRIKPVFFCQVFCFII